MKLEQRLCLVLAFVCLVGSCAAPDGPPATGAQSVVRMHITQDPASLSPGAPTIASSPLMETALPKLSPAAASAAVSLATCIQSPAASRSNTYADPESSPASSSPSAPTIA